MSEITTAQACAALRLSRRTLQEYAAAGAPSRLEGGRRYYDLALLEAWILEHRAPAAGAPAEESGRAREARLRIDEARASLLETRAARERGELVCREAAVRSHAAICLAIRQALDWAPARFAPEIAGALGVDSNAATEQVRVALEAACDEIARGLPPRFAEVLTRLGAALGEERLGVDPETVGLDLGEPPEEEDDDDEEADTE